MLDEGSIYYSQTEGTNVTWPYLPGALSSNNNNITNNNNNQGGWESVDWEDSSDNFLQMWLLFVTLLNNFVPLSLYVTLEIVTFSLMWFINNDRTMYHTKTDTAAVSRSTIVSDLGQVEYIFSDKTGTLTQNVMRFKRCSVDGMVFGAVLLLLLSCSSVKRVPVHWERRTNGRAASLAHTIPLTIQRTSPNTLRLMVSWY